jgi:hypothetical protein
VARELADQETEVSVLLPERKYKGVWHRVLHDRTGDAIQEAVSHLAHANVTSIPFHFGSRAEVKTVLTSGAPMPASTPVTGRTPDSDRVAVRIEASGLDGTTPIVEARWRQRVTVIGQVRSLRVAPLRDAPTVELVLVDRTGAISVVFLGRRAIAGVDVGTRMSVDGMVGVHQSRLAILNPGYRLLD